MSRVVALMAGLAGAFWLFAQRIDFEGHDEGPRPQFPVTGEFHFVRLEYNDIPQFHRRWGYASRSGTGTG